jgi:hypothetical protein
MLDVLTLTGIDTTYAIQTEQMGCVWVYVLQRAV